MNSNIQPFNSTIRKNPMNSIKHIYLPNLQAYATSLLGFEPFSFIEEIKKEISVLCLFGVFFLKPLLQWTFPALNILPLQYGLARSTLF